MKVLIKFGGTLLEDATTRTQLAKQLSEVAGRHQLVVVHGGGKQVTGFLNERGVSSRFVNGLRVTDEAVIDAVIKVISGTVNQQLVSALVPQGVPAVGLSGIDGPLTVAEQLDPQLGWVGRPVHTDAKLLNLLSDAGYVPVIACVAGDEKGHVYNVNADQMAVSCAAGWGATRLLFLTDVPGVKGRDGGVLQDITIEQSQTLVASGVAHGGMQAKLEAAESAITGGVGEVVIAPGREPDICLRLLAGYSIGTRIHQAAKTL